jgi:SAM-dependent methyltransferase
MLPFDWIRRRLKPEVCTSCTFIYDDMASQSGEALPFIYQPFDIRRRDHWRDRGALFDFLFTAGGVEASLLDFGSGDGWPSLIVAPYARRVTGVDASTRRARVCAENAARLGLTNVGFVAVAPTRCYPLPTLPSMVCWQPHPSSSRRRP